MPLGFGAVVRHSLFAAADGRGEPFQWRMGVRSTDAGQWLQPDDRRVDDLREKEALRARLGEETFVARPGSEAAGAEVLSLVEGELRRLGLSVASARRHPLDTAGLSVQEDLCLLEPDAGSWRLSAASVCFPTRWDLPSKLGRSLREIHDPVPGYREQLGDQVDRFFDRMTPGALAARLNWSVVGDERRRLDPREPQAPPGAPVDPGRDLFVRVERQTLRRLVDHPAIVFGIRIHVWPLEEVVDDLPGPVLADLVESMPVDVADYKDLEALRPGLVEWLRTRPPTGSTP